MNPKRTMSHDEFVADGEFWHEEKDRRMKAMGGVGGPKAGRPRKNGFEAPEGDLDRETAGDA